LVLIATMIGVIITIRMIVPRREVRSVELHDVE